MFVTCYICTIHSCNQGALFLTYWNYVKNKNRHSNISKINVCIIKIFQNTRVWSVRYWQIRYLSFNGNIYRRQRLPNCMWCHMFRWCTLTLNSDLSRKKYCLRKYCYWQLKQVSAAIYFLSFSPWTFTKYINTVLLMNVTYFVHTKCVSATSLLPKPYQQVLFMRYVRYH